MSNDSKKEFIFEIDRKGSNDERISSFISEQEDFRNTGTILYESISILSSDFNDIALNELDSPISHFLSI